MESFLVSTGIVAISEIGDKTQLLALILAARFRKPWPIIWGILLATLLNHSLAAWLGVALAEFLGPEVLRLVLGASFIAMAVWVLVPDKADDEPRALDKAGPFIASLVAFFLLEIGDKTQIATIALAAQFQDLFWVTMGTTTGMMLADVPAVFLGEAAAKKIPLAWVMRITALIFASLGIFGLAFTR